MALKFEDISLFIELSDFNSFSEAAIMLNVPQPTISRKVKRLETAVGQRLFIRGLSQVKLSDFGQAFLQRAFKIQHAFNDADSFISQSKTMPEGRLTIEAQPVLADMLLQGFIQKFSQKYPLIVVELNTIQGDAWLKPLKKGIRLLENYPHDENLIAKPFISSEQGFFASPAFLRQHTKITHPSELVNLPCILRNNYRSQPNMWQYLENSEVKQLEVKGSLIVDSGPKAEQAAINNLGVIWSPRAVVEQSLAQNKLIELFPQREQIQANSFIIFRDRPYLPLHERVFIDELSIFKETRLCHD